MPIKRRWRLATLPPFALALFALILTQSRGGWAAFAISFALVMILSWQRGWMPAIVPTGLLIGGAFASIFVFGLVYDRLTGSDGGSSESRIVLSEIALLMVEDHPLTGVGVNNFGTVLPRYVPPHLGSEWLYTVHNKYLLIFSETGIFGIAGFVGFLVWTAVKGFQLWQKRDRFYSPIGLAIGALVVGHATHLIVDTFNYRPLVQMLWVLSALVTAATLMYERERQAAQTHVAVIDPKAATQEIQIKPRSMLS
jgi:O-antigen ligase